VHAFGPWLRIGPGLVPGDLPRLRRAGVRAILSLQEPGDIAPAAVEGIRVACAAPPEVAYRRVPIRDYDPGDLVARLPAAVAELDRLLEGGRIVYLHCTEGVNRAPSVALGHAVLSLGEPCDAALARLRAAHPMARPYDLFIDWLRSTATTR
jgi:hypothetical protein